MSPPLTSPLSQTNTWKAVVVVVFLFFFFLPNFVGGIKEKEQKNTFVYEFLAMWIQSYKTRCVSQMQSEKNREKVTQWHFFIRGR